LHITEMLRVTRRLVNVRFYSAVGEGDKGHSDVRNVTQPILKRKGAKTKDLKEVLEGVKEKKSVETLTNQDYVMEVSGVPEEHQYERRARVYKPARNAEQAGWNNTNLWKIELDLQERWENPTIGYCSNADPLSSISMQLDFPSADDAIAFCEKNKWPYTVEREQIHQIKPKAYGSNFHWSKRTRVGTK